MRLRSSSLVFLILFTVGCSREEGPTVDQEADRRLRDMSTLLAEAPRFSFSASETRDIVDAEGQTQQLQLEHRAYVERPNRVRREVTLGDDSALLIYNTGALAVHTTRDSFFGITEIPPTIDEGMDYLFERLDVRAPLADLIYTSPYDAYVDSMTAGQYVGEETVEGATCHHLAFQHPAIDFDIWLQDGDRPLPCKLQLSYKQDEGAPKSVLIFRDWDLSPTFEPHLFAYRPPEGYVRIPFIGLRDAIAAAPAETEGSAAENEGSPAQTE